MLFRRLAFFGALALGLVGSSRVGRTSTPTSEAPPSPLPLAFVAALEVEIDDGAQKALVSQPFVEPFFPYLDDEDPNASISIGDTSHGSVVHAKRIREDDALAILPRQRERDLGFGGDELVALLQEAGRALHNKTGTKLWIGNIGRRGGGDIPWSVSHNAGRDADVAFAYTDDHDKPVDPPDLVPVDGRGESKAKELRFDTARTWTIVRALLESKAAQVQYLFLSEPLKGKLLRYAKEKGEPGWLISRAGDVLHQPAGAPHDDHLHVRVFCSARDVGGGCQDTGVVHDWSRLATGARAARIAASLTRLDGADATQRTAAIQRLAVLDAKSELERVLAHLEDPDLRVRAAAALATGALGETKHADVLAARFDREREASVKIAVLGAMKRLGGPVSGALIARAIGGAPPPCLLEEPRESRELELFSIDPRLAFTPVPELVSVACIDAEERAALTAAAIDAAGFADRTEPVEPLLGVVAGPDLDARVRAAEALERITNRALAEAVRTEADPTSAILAFRRSIAQVTRAPRDAWVATGFLAAGYEIPRFEKKNLWEAVRALGHRDHLAYNAQKILERVTEHKAPWLAFDADRTCGEWLSYVAAHRRSLTLDPAPDAVVKACERKRAQ